MIVSGLFIYPVKSAKGIQLDVMDFDSLGPLFDRRFMVIDEENKMLTQRECPILSTLKTQINFEKKELTLSFQSKDENEEMRLSLSMKEEDYTNNKSVDVQVWRDNVQGLYCEEEAELFLTKFLERKARMIFTSQNRKRPVPQNEGHGMSFVDSSPLLVISEESLFDLNKRLKKTLTMGRFRPNIVLSGGEAFSEDELSEYNIGDARLKSFKRCSRCIMVTIDQEKGQKSDIEPLKVFNSYRSFEGGVMFGVSAFNTNAKKIKKGDHVEV